MQWLYLAHGYSVPQPLRRSSGVFEQIPNKADFVQNPRLTAMEVTYADCAEGFDAFQDGLCTAHPLETAHGPETMLERGRLFHRRSHLNGRTKGGMNRCPAGDWDNHRVSVLVKRQIFFMFGRLKSWRRVATCYDRCPKVFLSAITLAALVIYWL